MTAGSLLCPQCQGSTDVIQGVPAAFCPHCRLPLRRVAGKYQITRLLGEGGFGFVYLAHHSGLRHKPERVIKVMRPEIFQQPGMKARFAREIQLTSSLSAENPHIVQIHDDFGEEDGFGAYYVMEYLRGQTLFELFQTQPRLPHELAFHIFRQICDGMAAAHARGIVHRDLKPENIFLVTREEDPYFVKILDFGIAKIFEDETATRLTKGAVGTPAYMAPEQCLNQKVDHRADIYALGILLYQMLSGLFPFPDKTDQALPTVLFVVQSHLIVPARPLREAAPSLSISEGMDRAILRALEKKPDDRYPSIESFWSEIFRQMTQQSTQIHWRPTPPSLETSSLRPSPPSNPASPHLASSPPNPASPPSRPASPHLASPLLASPPSPASSLRPLPPSNPASPHFASPPLVSSPPSLASISREEPSASLPLLRLNDPHVPSADDTSEDDPFAFLGADGLPDSLKTEEIQRPPEFAASAPDASASGAFEHSLALPPAKNPLLQPPVEEKKPKTSAYQRPEPPMAAPPSWSLDLGSSPPPPSTFEALPSEIPRPSASPNASKGPDLPPLQGSSLEDFFSSPRHAKADRQTRSVIRERPMQLEKSFPSSEDLGEVPDSPASEEDHSRTTPGDRPLPSLAPPEAVSPSYAAPRPSASPEPSKASTPATPRPPASPRLPNASTLASPRPSASAPADSPHTPNLAEASPLPAPAKPRPSSPALIPMTPSKAKPIPAEAVSPPASHSDAPPPVQAREMKLDAILDAFQKRQASGASEHPADPLFPSSPVRLQRPDPQPSFFQRLSNAFLSFFKFLFLLFLGFALGYLLLVFLN